MVRGGLHDTVAIGGPHHDHRVRAGIERQAPSPPGEPRERPLELGVGPGGAVVERHLDARDPTVPRERHPGDERASGPPRRIRRYATSCARWPPSPTRAAPSTPDRASSRPRGARATSAASCRSTRGRAAGPGSRARAGARGRSCRRRRSSRAAIASAIGSESLYPPIAWKTTSTAPSRTPARSSSVATGTPVHVAVEIRSPPTGFEMHSSVACCSACGSASSSS